MNFSSKNKKISKKISKKFLQKSLICDIIYKHSIIIIEYRGVAQLVARVVWDHEVAGSIPVTSTKFSPFLRKFKRICKNSKTMNYAIFQRNLRIA